MLDRLQLRIALVQTPYAVYAVFANILDSPIPVAAYTKLRSCLLPSLFTIITVIMFS